MVDEQLKAPMFVTWYQCIVAVVASYVLGSLRHTASFMEMFPTFEYDISKAKKVRQPAEWGPQSHSSISFPHKHTLSHAPLHIMVSLSLSAFFCPFVCLDLILLAEAGHAPECRVCRDDCLQQPVPERGWRSILQRRPVSHNPLQHRK